MSEDLEKKKFVYSLILPSVFVFTIWVVWLLDYYDNLNLYQYGNLPRSQSGIIGIFISPFLHSDLNHIISNSITLLILGTGIIFFYRQLAYKIILLLWTVGGLFVWMAARDSYHIGASGLIYGIASFLFFGGIFRKDVRLTAISLLVVFLYGGLVWGIFPFTPGISWEYHLISALCGLVLAQIYKKEGPSLPTPPFDDETNEEMDEEDVVNPKETENKIEA